MKPEPGMGKKVKPDRFRGIERKDRPGQGSLINFLQEAERSGALKTLQDESRKAWTILGRAEWVARGFKEIARGLGLTWTGGDFTGANPESVFERDLTDGAFALHALRDSYDRGDIENAACHLMQLGILYERCRARLFHRSTRLGRNGKEVKMFTLLDAGYSQLTEKAEHGVNFTCNAVFSYIVIPKTVSRKRMKDSTKAAWFTRWKKARGY